MSKQAKPIRRVSSTSKKKTNWLLIAGGTAVGAIVMFGLLFLALREPPVQTLASYCNANPDRCEPSGDNDAPVTVVEVSDYGCSHCRDFNLEKASLLHEQYVVTGDVKWVFLPFSLDDTRQPAAEAAMCAGDQEKFAEYHYALFALQNSPQAFTRDGYLSAAQSAGIPDIAAFTECMDSREYRSIVQENRSAARRAGVTGTPTFYINDVKVEGNRPLGDFQQLIGNLIN